ncbi:MAG: cysteine synthase A [Spirochaetales bacterium]
MIYTKIYEAIGNTPIVKMQTTDKNIADVYAKLEFFNAGSSVKDRVAKSMIFNMMKDGLLSETDTVIEPTSGNTGIGIAMICASLGIKCVFTMPESMSVERQKLLKAYGAEIILTPASEGMSGAIKTAKTLQETKGYVMLKQFENEYNPLAHKNTTACEIIQDFDSLDACICGIGTGGTVTGVGEVLKKHYKDIKIIGVEPAGSPFLTQGKKGPHKIQGIGAGFKPDVLNLDVPDEIITVSDEDALSYMKQCGITQGILPGISGGAAYKVALDIAKQLGTGKKVLFIMPDNGERYLTLFDN